MSAEHDHGGSVDNVNTDAVAEGLSRVIAFIGMISVLSAVLFATPQILEKQIENLNNATGESGGHH